MMEPPSTPDSKASAESVGGSSPFVIPPTPMMSKIGYGTGVSVYHLQRSPRFGDQRSPWAMKKKNARALRGNITERLAKEAQILRSLDHPNIVGFRGFRTTPDGSEVLLMEECTQALGDFIMNFSKDYGAFSPPTIFQVLSSVSKALHYLHTERKLIHGDIKSYNVLIKGQFESIKLCDFGVSLEIGEDGTSKEEYVGTLPWTAPEALLDGPVTPKADIFALGMTLYEMLTLKQPHIDSCDESMMDSTAGSVILDESIEEPPYGTRPHLPELGSEYDAIVSIFNWCTEEDYQKRPTAKDILDTLDK